MIGLPGTGKSTFINTRLANLLDYSDDFFKEQSVIISNDQVLEEYAAREGLTYSEAFGKVPYEHIGVECFRRFNEAVSKEIPNIIIDNTHMTQKSRSKYRAKNYDLTCVIFTVVNHREHLRRLSERTVTGKVIPSSVIESMKQQYEVPSVTEGFNNFIQVWVQ